jgi:hypothetical protein
MKTEETITTIPGGGAGISPLGSHAFLDEFALSYHRAVAERLRAEYEAVLERARQNLNRRAEGDAFGAGERPSLEEWQRILGEADVNRLIDIMTDTSDEGQRLRSSSPFVGPLSPEERLEILAACEQRAARITAEGLTRAGDEHGEIFKESSAR